MHSRPLGRPLFGFARRVRRDALQLVKEVDVLLTKLSDDVDSIIKYLNSGAEILGGVSFLENAKAYGDRIELERSVLCPLARSRLLLAGNRRSLLEGREEDEGRGTEEGNWSWENLGVYIHHLAGEHVSPSRCGISAFRTDLVGARFILLADSG